ncbi:hypothetical protein QBC44DRAFT_380050 [Cladorrhinum sp. PSN332]|nr:hypothetical protein QBC44DRAFT_380050 [Cladorrhinum sp. PSN332]
MPPPRKKQCSSRRAPGSVLELYTNKGPNSRQIVIISDGDESDESDTETAPTRISGHSGSVPLMARLQRDAFRDLKYDICAGLDGIPTYTIKTDPENHAVERLLQTVQCWTNKGKISRPTDHLYYRLHNKYSEANFSPRVLQKRDQAVVEALIQVSEDTPLEFFFAVLDRENNREIEPPASYLIRKLLDRKGQALLHDVPLVHSNWLQSYLRPLTPRDPTLFEVAIVLIPRDSVADFLIPGAKFSVQLTSSYCLERAELQVVVEHYIEAVAAQGGERVLPILKDVCIKAWSLDQTLDLAIFPHAVVEKIIKGVVLARDFAFFEQVAAKVGGRLPSSFFRWVAEEIQTGRIAANDVERGILAAVSTFPDAHSRCYTTAALINLSDEDSRSLLRKLVTLALEAVDTHAPGRFQGEGLVGLVAVVLGPEATKSALIPLVEKHITQTSFALGALKGLRRLPQHLALSSKLLKRLAKLAIDALDVSTLAYIPLGPLEEISDTFGKFSPPKPVPSGAIDAYQLSDFVSDLIAEGVNDDLLRRLFVKIAAAADLIRIKEFASLWFPFLKNLIGILEEHRIPLSTPRYHHIFAALLESYLLRGVGIRPPWWNPQTTIPCQCSLCVTVNGFLQAPEAAVVTIRALTPEGIAHVNGYVAHYAVQIRCELKFSNGDLIVSKHPGSQPPWAKWLHKKEAARAELAKFDTAKLETILGGDDFVNLVHFDILEPEEKAVDSGSYQGTTTTGPYQPPTMVTPSCPQPYQLPNPVAAPYGQPYATPLSGGQPQQAGQWAAQRPHSSLPTPATSVLPRPMLSTAAGANPLPAYITEPSSPCDSRMVPASTDPRNSVPNIITSHVPPITTPQRQDRNTPGCGAFPTKYTDIIMAAKNPKHTPQKIRYGIEAAWDETPEQRRQAWEKKAEVAFTRTPGTPSSVISKTQQGVNTSHKAAYITGQGSRIAGAPAMVRNGTSMVWSSGKPVSSNAASGVLTAEISRASDARLSGNRGTTPSMGRDPKSRPASSFTPSTTQNRVTTLPTSSPSRVLAPVSANRMNQGSAVPPRVQFGALDKVSLVKARPPATAPPPRAVKRKVVDIIDLTGDSD